MTEPSPLAKGYGPSPLLSTPVSVKQGFCGHTCMTSKNPGLADVYGDRFNWMQKTIAATNSECIRGNRGSLQGDMTSLSITLTKKFGKIWETSMELLDISMLL
jgi:hypothetical protein